MPRFIYTAKSEPYKTTQGVIEAESENDALTKLTRLGLFPIVISSENSSHYAKVFWNKISAKELALFTRQLATLLECGVNILNALNILSNQIANKNLKLVLKDIISKIKDGKSFSESLSGHPGIFSSLYISMVHSGEAGGQMETVLKRLAEFTEKEEEFKNTVSSALIYPAFILSVSVITVIVLFTFVIPKLVGMFKDMGQALPVPTQVLVNISDFLRNWWWLFLAAMFMLIFFLRRMYKTTQGRIIFDGIKMRLPVMGTLVIKTEISRLMRTLSLLISNGIPIVYALDISASVMENMVLKLETQGFKDKLSAGESFSQCLAESKLFPGFVTSIVNTAEEGGTLEKSLGRLAEDYEKDVDRTLKTLARLLEPVIILVMGSIVGFIVIAMMLPIFEINLIVK
ncbi:MAG: type II secretion system F family protein [Candidatus Omnitrophica bacterium]|nr:type II secretion system F family protein [Candidatus Omnitrophota bacterium]